MAKTIVITGAGGFLGQEILRQGKDHKELTFHAITSDPSKLKALTNDNIRFFSTENYQEAFAGDVDVLLNCAFPRTDNEDMANGLLYIKNILDHAMKTNIQKVINISSQSVYSQVRMEEAQEDTDIILESKYAVGKYAVELLVNSICASKAHTNLRMASLIGPGFDQRIINKLVIKMINGENITLMGGNQRFGFMDVRDAAGGIIATLVHDNDSLTESYNFGNNQSYTLYELSSICVNAAKRKNIKDVNVSSDETVSSQNTALNADAFMKTFKWKPVYSMEASVNDIFDNLLQRMQH